MGTGRGLHPPDDEPHRRGDGLSLEGGVGGLGHSGGAVQPVGDRRPGSFGYGLDEIAQAGVLADGDGKADIRLSAGGHHGVGVAAAVGAHGELPAGPAVADPAHRLPQEVGGAASGVGSALAQPRHQHVAGASDHGQQRVVAPLAGVAMVACALLGQTVASLCPRSGRAEATNWVQLVGSVNADGDLTHDRRSGIDPPPLLSVTAGLELTRRSGYYWASPN